MPSHSFVVGETYRDRRGTYRVISINGNRIVYDYGDGVQFNADVETKWRIDRNILLGERSSLPSARPSEARRPATDEQFWDGRGEVDAIFAEIIKSYGRQHKEFMAHERMVAAFIAHPEGQRILQRPHDHRPNDSWVGIMLAWFSRRITRGTSEWQASFERRKIGRAWAYRVRKANLK